MKLTIKNVYILHSTHLRLRKPPRKEIHFTQKTFLWAKKLNKNEITNHYESVIKDILSTQTPNPAHFSTPTITKKETSILKHTLPKISLK